MIKDFFHNDRKQPQVKAPNYIHGWITHRNGTGEFYYGYSRSTKCTK